MAGLLYKKLLFIAFGLIFLSQSANAFESSFPFPFEFGHSSDIYLNVKKESSDDVRRMQSAKEILVARKISDHPTSIIKYIKKNEIEKIVLLLDAGYSPNTMLHANYPIYYAARYNKPRIVHILLKAGADPNRDYVSPLRYAVLHKDYDCVKTLIEYNADVNFVDQSTGESLLYTALRKRYYEIAKLLIKNGAKIDARSARRIEKRKLDSKLGLYY